MICNSATIRYNDDYVKRPIDTETYRVLNVIEFGYDNLFPQALALLSRMSPNHRGVINSKIRYCAGSGVVTEDKLTENWLARVNNNGESFSTVYKKILRDDITFGNIYIEIIIDRTRKNVQIAHIDSTTCRISKDKKRVIINPTWRTAEPRFNKELPLYPNFEMIDGAFRSVVHVKDYEPEYYNYGLPEYIGGKNAAQIDWKAGRWNLTKLEKAFNISGMMFVPVKDEEESKAVLNYIKKNYQGAEASETMLVIAKSRAPEGQKAEDVQVVEAGKSMSGDWKELHSMNIDDLLVAHSWFRSLSGIADNTGFDTNRVLNEYSIAKATVIQPTQQKYKELFQRIYYDITRKELVFDFLNYPPVDDGKGYFLWEIRKAKGLPYDENSPAQQIIVS
jgi:hypothetical protein